MKSTRTILAACQHGVFVALLLQVTPARAQSPRTPPTAITAATAQFDRLDAPGTTWLQRRLVLLEGQLIFGKHPCSEALRWDAKRGVTMGCLQFGLLGRLQPVLAALDAARPDGLALAFGDRAADVRAMLRLPSTEEQAKWGRSLSDGNGQLADPWASAFARLAAMPDFQAVYLASTNTRFRTALQWASRFGLRSSRGVAMMFDLSLYAGIAADDLDRLAAAADQAAAGRSGMAAEEARLWALAAARSELAPDDALLRFHLRSIAAGGTVSDGITLGFTALGISLTPMALPRDGDSGSAASTRFHRQPHE